MVNYLKWVSLFLISSFAFAQLDNSQSKTDNYQYKLYADSCLNDYTQVLDLNHWFFEISFDYSLYNNNNIATYLKPSISYNQQQGLFWSLSLRLEFYDVKAPLTLRSINSVFFPSLSNCDFYIRLNIVKQR